MSVKSIFSKVSLPLAMVVMLCSAQSAFAGSAKIQLRSNDGTTILVGDLIDFSNGAFTIRTDLGDILIPKHLVTCKGEACPIAPGVRFNIDA
ncbi:hypothetical protein [Parasulfitobacter algicola]|uniref:Uncharacterized protein n=1 Tax=Parasulfitobacter algicola TaxID=2614809 RepID=A0ABX2IUF6_9RHOB|nr:hypothetical protein [Sulfitobacter algicola]NSX56190.1 hypothetical protein [Sulfitobacter algicola]